MQRERWNARDGRKIRAAFQLCRFGRDHPLRAIRLIANEALSTLASDFSELYSKTGRPSVAPERLLRAMLLQAFYSVRSERQLVMERLDTDLLFRWFVGLSIDDPVDATVFSKNRGRLLDGAIAAKFLAAVLAQPRVKKLMSSEHFSVDGTLVEAWASMKSSSGRRMGQAMSRRPAREQRRCGFQGRETFEPDARLDHRSRSLTLPQARGHGGEAGLPRPSLGRSPSPPQPIISSDCRN